MNKAQLIRHIAEDAAAKKVIGNILWAVQDNCIHCHLLQQKGQDWELKKTLHESDNLEFYNCPIKYLTLTQTISQKWRSQVIRHHEENKNKPDEMYREIEEAFAKATRSGQRVFVVLKPKPGYSISGPELEIIGTDHPEHGIIAQGKKKQYYFDTTALKRVYEIKII